MATQEEQMTTAGERASDEEDDADEDGTPEHPLVVADHRRYIAELAGSVREWVGSAADVRFAPMEGRFESLNSSYPGRCRERLGCRGAMDRHTGG